MSRLPVRRPKMELNRKKRKLKKNFCHTTLKKNPKPAIITERLNLFRKKTVLCPFCCGTVERGLE